MSRVRAFELLKTFIVSLLLCKTHPFKVRLPYRFTFKTSLWSSKVPELREELNLLNFFLVERWVHTAYNSLIKT